MQAREFERLYEKTRITVSVASAREVVGEFLRGEVQTIFLDRPLAGDEWQLARTYKIPIDTFRIAAEGIAVIVNAKNPVTALNLAQVGAIYRGAIQSWQEVGGKPLAILPVALSRNSGTADFMLAHAIQDTAFGPASYICASSAKLLQMVAERENSIGFLSSAWLSDSVATWRELEKKLRTLRLAPAATTAFVGLYQASVYHGDYPLHRPLYLFSRDRRLGVAVGLISFVTSAAGQKLILNAGLVPATMPIKLVKFRS